MFKRLLLSMFLLGLARARAQGPLSQPAPLTRPAGATVGSPGGAALSLAAAQRAQELGLPSLAADLYRRLLEAPGADRAGLTLALATSLLDAGEAAEAEKVLNGFVGLRGAPWQLRAGLAAAQLKKTEAARAALAAARLEELGGADRPWWYFLSGLVAEAAGDAPRANEAYDNAVKASSTELSRARFLLASERARLQRLSTVDEAQLRQAMDNYNRFRSGPAGYQFVVQVAVMREALKQHGPAVSFLQEVLLVLPPEEKARADEFRLTLGLIAGLGREPAGRTALMQLLEGGVDADKQRIALQLLASAADTEPARVAFRAELDKLIDGPTPHRILESLLLYRAQVALAERTTEGFARAEDDARQLLNKFPGSPLRVQVYGVLTASAWEQRRYRTAADSAARARAELANATRDDEVRARAKLGVLEAEARFRAGEAQGDAGDYRAAADAYAAVLRERAGVFDPRERSAFMFQRVMAEIRAGTPEGAEPVLDELGRNAAFDLEDRWKSEWNLARALQVAGKTAAAYARVQRLLETAPAGAAQLKPELRARMEWLRARLSLEAGQPRSTLELAKNLANSLGEIDAALRNQIVSSAVLLRAEAHFLVKEEAEALKALQEIRGNPDFAASDAAVYSYIIEANYHANQDQTAKAQGLLTQLADKFPKNDYAPYALFQAALQSERLGQEKNYRDANGIIVRLVTNYPQSPLVFAARLKQGELLRKLNDFSGAQLVYEDLINRFPQHGDVIYAKLALAETLNALSAPNQERGNDALVADVQARFEALRDLADERHIDVRVEAGYNLGALLARRGEAKKALEVWWRDVAEPFLINDANRAGRLGATGRYWMSRTLFEVGALYEKQAKLAEAERAWRLIIEAKLPGDAVARGKLERFKLPEARP
ncbi:MAG: tetratricopeptide repeat protein [Verrucomicrobia bacterium]|nr:tetratricopeptide repeat protein [Verrucomicrobiota bacterium]